MTCRPLNNMHHGSWVREFQRSKVGEGHVRSSSAHPGPVWRRAEERGCDTPVWGVAWL